MINIIKSQPSPPCLSIEKDKANGDYKCEGVLNKLVDDFHNKCYICEEKAPSTMNVEHFKPHKGDKELKFDWNNLFLACGHCNNIKLAKYDDIIDCTDSSRLVLDLLRFQINPFPGEKVEILPLTTGKEVNLTAQFLNEVYNGTTELKTIEGKNIRDKLLKEVIGFQKLLFDYFEDGLNQDDKLDIRKKNKRRLSAESGFTAFKFWVIKNNDVLLNEFGGLIN